VCGAPAARFTVTGPAPSRTSAQCQVAPVGVTFQRTHGPASTRTQKESSPPFAAITRAQTLQVAVAGTVNVAVAVPVAGGAVLLLLPAATDTYRPPDAAGSAVARIGSVSWRPRVPSRPRTGRGPGPGWS
jgi:hypothetical protein